MAFGMPRSSAAGLLNVPPSFKGGEVGTGVGVVPESDSEPPPQAVSKHVEVMIKNGLIFISTIILYSVFNYPGASNTISSHNYFKGIYNFTVQVLMRCYVNEIRLAGVLDSDFT